jgi:hypothetical protein
LKSQLRIGLINLETKDHFVNGVEIQGSIAFELGLNKPKMIQFIPPNVEFWWKHFSSYNSQNKLVLDLISVRTLFSSILNYIWLIVIVILILTHQLILKRISLLQYYKKYLLVSFQIRDKWKLVDWGHAVKRFF